MASASGIDHGLDKKCPVDTTTAHRQAVDATRAQTSTERKEELLKAMFELDQHDEQKQKRHAEHAASLCARAGRMLHLAYVGCLVGARKARAWLFGRELH